VHVDDLFASGVTERNVTYRGSAWSSLISSCRNVNVNVNANANANGNVNVNVNVDSQTIGDSMTPEGSEAWASEVYYDELTLVMKSIQS
jgi:hypothetical protein